MRPTTLTLRLPNWRAMLIAFAVALCFVAFNGSNAFAAPNGNSPITCAAGNSLQIKPGTAVPMENPCSGTNLVVKTDVDNGNIMNHGLNGWTAAAERIAASKTGGTFWLEAAPAQTGSKVAPGAQPAALPKTGGNGASNSSAANAGGGNGTVDCTKSVWLFSEKRPFLHVLYEALTGNDVPDKLLEDDEALADVLVKMELPEHCRLTMISPWSPGVYTDYNTDPSKKTESQTTVGEFIDAWEVLSADAAKKAKIANKDEDFRLTRGSFWLSNEPYGTYTRSGKAYDGSKEKASGWKSSYDFDALNDRIDKLGLEADDRCDLSHVVFESLDDLRDLDLGPNCAEYPVVALYFWDDGKYAASIRPFETLDDVISYGEDHDYTRGSVWFVAPEELNVTVAAIMKFHGLDKTKVKVDATSTKASAATSTKNSTKPATIGAKDRAAFEAMCAEMGYTCTAKPATKGTTSPRGAP